jgi:glycosyltransferase involved in cell wall biosynthesis
MYILIIGRGYMPANAPMLGIFEFDQAKVLYEAGHKVIYVSLDLRSFRRIRKFGKSHFVKEGIEVYDISIPLGRLPFSIMYCLGKAGLLYLYKDIEKKHGKPDVIHAHFTLIASISSILKQRYNIPFVTTEHSSLLAKDILNRNTIKAGKIAYKYADKVIAVSHSLSHYIKFHFNIDSIVIHNIIDFKYFTNNYDVKAVNKDDFVFLSVGNLIYRKGFDILIRSFYLSNFNNHVKLLIIGHGDDAQSLEKLIKEYGVQDNIKLLGFKNRKDIAFYMQNCNAFVLASRAETFGVVYAEALATGKPVIATKCGGPEDFIDKHNGLLVPVNDVDALKNALIYMLVNFKSYDSKFIAEKCKNLFSDTTIACHLIDAYKKIIRPFY